MNLNHRQPRNELFSLSDLKSIDFMHYIIPSIVDWPKLATALIVGRKSVNYILPDNAINYITDNTDSIIL